MIVLDAIAAAAVVLAAVLLAFYVGYGMGGRDEARRYLREREQRDT